MKRKEGGGEGQKKAPDDGGKIRLARNSMYRITFLRETSDQKEVATIPDYKIVLRGIKMRKEEQVLFVAQSLLFF